MSDQSGTGPLPELTAEQEAEVRRLLAEARHEEPLPAHVATRLDDVLADLSRETRSPVDEPAAPVVIDLAARRRRRNAAALLASAAAVIVAGFAIGQGIDVTRDSADDNVASSGGSSVARDQAGADTGSAESPADGTRSPEPKSGAEAANPEVATEPVRLRSTHLRRDITAQMKALAADQAMSPMSGSLLQEFSAAHKCSTPQTSASMYGPGGLFPAYYDGIPAVLALGPDIDGTREASVLSCTTGQPLRTVTVKAP